MPRDPGSPAPASNDPRTDRELLAAHVAGDGGAFPELVSRHRRRLWNLALRSLRDREDAADALQDGFVRAFRAAGGYRGDAEVVSWLHHIVLNVSLDRIAARRRRPTLPLDDEVRGEHGTDLIDRRDAFAEVDARSAAVDLLAQLPHEQRSAIVLVDVEGYSVADAADQLGIAVGTVKSRCARGRAKLAAALTRARDPAAAGQTRPRDGLDGKGREVSSGEQR